jgi:transglutaminase superfamily protein
VAARLEALRSLAVAVSSPTLARLSPERLARVLEPRTTPTDRRPSALSAVEQALGVTSRFIRHTCYTRGITRYYVLRRAGFDVSLVFGIERETASPGAHCWIVLDGEVYRESVDPTERFVRAWAIGGAR